MIWNPGDGSDLFEGGDGNDTAQVNGGNGAEDLHHHGQRHRACASTASSPAPFSLDIGTTENLVLNANGGDDVITAGNGLASLIQPHARRRRGQRHDHRRRRQRHADRRRRQRRRHRRPRQRQLRSSAPATTRSSGTRATAATRSTAGTAPTRCCSTAPTSTRTSTSRGQWQPRDGSPATSATSPWTSTASSSIQLNALGGADTSRSAT